MKTFIVLTFFLLGWVFWEMSGGSDFEPRQLTAQADDTQNSAGEETPIFVAGEEAEIITRSRAVPTNKPQVRRGTELAQLDTGLVSNTPEKSTLFASDVDESELAEPEISLASLSEDDSAFSGTINTSGLSLRANSSAVNDAVEQAVAAPALQLGTVSGSTVNMRGGPGTEYEVLAQLQRGDAVEIIADPGTGWYKLRPVSGGPTGWMSASLIQTEG